VGRFSRVVAERPLRPYQVEPARAIVDSVRRGQGLTFAVMMARQAGKNELSGQLEAYLLNLNQRRGGQIVKASPTFKPQTLNSLDRLADRLNNAWNGGPGGYQRRAGYIIELGAARALFFSAEPTANVVGATADLLLEGDEAQEIAPEKWHKDFAPMAASTNATTVLYGTAWSTDTLLAQTIHHLRRQEAGDGIRRVFTYDADQVAAHLPAYGRYLRQQVERLGRDHPLIRSQYYLEAVDAGSRLFPPARRALMRGEHPRRHEPRPVLSEAGAARCHYALLVDVAGEEESAGAHGAVQLRLFQNPRRDATALTVVEIEPRPGGLPCYRTVDRRRWLGVRHATLYEEIRALARHWRAGWVVVDATGVGAGLASFLAGSLGGMGPPGPGRPWKGPPCQVLPVVFSAKLKSDLGWNFVAAVETGRYQEYALSEGGTADPDTRQFWYEVEHCQYEVLPGPGNRIRWGVWESPGYDGLVARGHDDLLVSAALCTVLDNQAWPGTGQAAVAARSDPLHEIDRGAW
jgi:hypothetical protein